MRPFQLSKPRWQSRQGSHCHRALPRPPEKVCSLISIQVEKVAAKCGNRRKESGPGERLRLWSARGRMQDYGPQLLVNFFRDSVSDSVDVAGADGSDLAADACSAGSGGTPVSGASRCAAPWGVSRATSTYAICKLESALLNTFASSLVRLPRVFS